MSRKYISATISLVIGSAIASSYYFFYNSLSWQTQLTQQHFFQIPMKDYQRKVLTSDRLNNEVNTKYILTWSEAYGSKKYFWEFGSEKFFEAGCPEARCFLTEDRNMLGSVADFDAILFHQRSFNLRTDRPKLRSPGQRYVHWMFESPAHLHYDITPLDKFKNFFNWSISYRLDSTFPTPHGSFRLKPGATPLEGNDLKNHIKQFSINNTHLANKTIIKGLAAAFVSNCNSESGRETVIKKLKEHLGVDVYGKGSCSDPGMACERSKDDKCLRMLSTSYKFYLSLENSLCADYITEKFFKVLDYNVIPVVINGVNMTKFAPPNSYIDLKYFKSIEEAAKYLIKVSEDDKLYASYFWWRDFYTTARNDWAETMCSLCSALHNNSAPTHVIPDMVQWWKTEAKCSSNIL